jgi:hypothetical protein
MYHLDLIELHLPHCFVFNNVSYIFFVNFLLHSARFDHYVFMHAKHSVSGFTYSIIEMKKYEGPFLKLLD